MLGGEDVVKQCRTVDIMADAAYVVLTRDSRSYTGQFFIDDDVLNDVGVSDLENYSCVPGEYTGSPLQYYAWFIIILLVGKKRRKNNNIFGGINMQNKWL